MRAPDATPIGEIIAETFSQLGRDDLPPAKTTALIHDTFCIGRRFRFGDVQAIWLTKENEIRFFDENENLLKVVAIAEVKESKESKQAA